MLQERVLRAGDVQLHSIDWGGGGMPLLLLAGLGNTAHIFRGLAPRLTCRFRVVGLTRRGHGRSARPPTGYDLDTLVEDIRAFLDRMGIERVVLAGSSFAGIEMPLLARRYPQRVAAIVYLDALFPRLEREPDFADDPVWSVQSPEPRAGDLESVEAYLSYQKRARPELRRIWCAAIEFDLLERVVVRRDGRLEIRHDETLMNRIAADVWPSRDPQYEAVQAPMLAIVPNGSFHHGVPPGTPDELRQAADAYWTAKILPWIRRRTAVFRQAALRAQIIELDAPHHLIFIAREDETVQAILDFCD